MRVITCIFTEHNLWLVGLAALMCALGATVSTRLWRRALLAQGRNRIDWLFLTGVTLGSAIWATHFIAMLGYRPGTSVTFDPELTLVSVIISIFGAALGLAISSVRSERVAVVVGGGTLGLSIAAMHYVGMFAYRVDGIVSWSMPYIITSLIVSIGFSGATVWAIRRWQAGPKLWLSTGLLVAAIVSLHFSGMAAFAVEPIAGLSAGADSDAFNAMALAIGLVALIIVGTGLSSSVIDDRSRASTETQLRHIALHDALTGIPNRRQFSETLAAATTGLSDHNNAFSLLMIDLDRFKPVNDSFGHPVGDVVLQRVAGRIKSVVGDRGVIARLGGDEFAVLSPRATRGGRSPEHLASEIVEIISRPFVIDGNIVELGASVGIVRAPRHGTDPDVLVQNADIALYDAKEAGRGTYRLFDPAMTAQLQLRRALEFDLRRAAAREEFTLNYQPQVDSGTGTIAGAEALIRWEHPERGNVPPGVFIPIAEELGLISAIGAWVLKQACRDAMTWPDHMKIAVNLSPVQLNDSLLPDLVRETLRETGLPASRLELEITETAILGNDEQALFILTQLKAMGIEISLDDFGTGYSSLSYLHSFPISRIKIDRSFIQKIPHDADGMSIVRAIAQLGSSLGLQITAEGIETTEQQEFSALQGCNHLQGYLISRPIPADAFAAFLDSSQKSGTAA